jgi:hypothetical protein
LDIFEQTISTSEPTKELIKRELLIFKRYQLDVKNIKCPLQWRQKHETMFSTIRFLAQQIFGIVGSQIEIEMIFYLARILINLRKCCLQIENLEKLIFVNKNWANDLRIRYKSPSNLLEFLEMDKLEKEV